MLCLVGEQYSKRPLSLSSAPCCPLKEDAMRFENEFQGWVFDDRVVLRSSSSAAGRHRCSSPVVSCLLCLAPLSTLACLFCVSASVSASASASASA